MDKMILFAFSILFMSATEAALISKLGGSLVYDTDLNITWLADTNIAATNTFGLPTATSLGTHPSDTSGFNGQIEADGRMNWPGAQHLADAMNGAGYLGGTNWRLPTTNAFDASCDRLGSGGIPAGLDCVDGEFEHLYNDEFNASYSGGIGLHNTGDANELVKFPNINIGWSWIGVDYPLAAIEGENAFLWDMNLGFKNATKKDALLFAWFVHDGDLAAAAVPLPGAAYLFGLAGLFLVRLARKNER